MKLPKKKYWYHGTTLDKAKTIISEGVLRDMGYGLYFANRNDYASTFAHMRDLPNFDQSVVVFKIPAKQIPNIELGCDHNPSSFPSDLITAVSYDCNIPVNHNHIQGHYEYSKETA
jgi:hypothetical protein